MNGQWISAMIQRAALFAAGWFASRYHLSPDQTAAIGVDLGAFGVGIYGAVAHWGKVKAVPGTIAGVIAAFMVISIFGMNGPAYAADLTLPKKSIIATTPCLPTSCSGWYVGAGLTGIGSNADIVGQGISNSVFAAGSIMSITGGYQYWNGQWFAAADASIGYELQKVPNTGSGNHLVGIELIKVGGKLSNLFGSGQAPVAVPANLSDALISPYITTGAMQRGGKSFSVSGAGAEFTLSQNFVLDLHYIYAPATDALPPQNFVGASLLRKF